MGRLCSVSTLSFQLNSGRWTLAFPEPFGGGLSKNQRVAIEQDGFN
jgi:hypothetical protein